MTNKYIKKALPVEAVLWDGANFEEVKEFILSKEPDKIVCEPLEKDIGCTCNCRSFPYKKGTILYYDKKDEKDIFKYGKDRLNHTSCFYTLSLGDYIFDFGSMVLSSLKKEEFEAEYKQQDSNYTSKPSDFSLRDLVMQIAPKHIKYYIERLEEYGFKLKYLAGAGISEKVADLPFIVLEDKNNNRIWIINHKEGIGTAFKLNIPCTNLPAKRDFCFGAPAAERILRFEVKNNNWREAFNKLVASFPDEIMKNTNHHAGLTS